MVLPFLRDVFLCKFQVLLFVKCVTEQAIDNNIIYSSVSEVVRKIASFQYMEFKVIFLLIYF